MLNFFKSRLDPARSVPASFETTSRTDGLSGRIDVRDGRDSDLDPDLAGTDERRRAVSCEEMFYWGMAGGPGY